ncbi:hypothetical protein [Ferrimicrobium sp.]|uniref:hypothetical protein n=1 Tax=Ferrimicrobium sp. TaxID=2926050 RepID=UPI0026100E4F|nr:hypothetical protein [Ferrimicrobium sp.]
MTVGCRASTSSLRTSGSPSWADRPFAKLAVASILEALSDADAEPERSGVVFGAIQDHDPSAREVSTLIDKGAAACVAVPRVDGHGKRGRGRLLDYRETFVIWCAVGRPGYRERISACRTCHLSELTQAVPKR